MFVEFAIPPLIITHNWNPFVFFFKIQAMIVQKQPVAITCFWKCSVDLLLLINITKKQY